MRFLIVILNTRVVYLPILYKQKTMVSGAELTEKYSSVARYLVFGLLGLVLWGYYHRYPTGDDAWFAEESYWLWHDGRIRSAFFGGFLDWQKQYFAAHKLFIGLGAVLMRGLPVSLYVSKLSGLLPFLVLIAASIYYVRESGIKSNQKTGAVWLLLLLFLANALVVRMSFENRPEMLVAALGFLSFLLLYPSQNQYFKIILSAILAGLALLTHLNGLIYVMAGFITLFIIKKYKLAFVFGFVATAVGSLYFYDIWQADGLQMWWFQMRNDPATQQSFGLLNKLKVMAAYPMLFFESPEQAGLSVLLLVVGWHYRLFIDRLNRSLVVYGLALFFCFWLITKSPTAIYQLLFVPTMLVFVVELYIKSGNQKLTTPLKIVVVLYLIIGVVGSGQIIIKNTKAYLPAQYATLSTKIAKNQSGIVPLTFFFNEYSTQQKLLCLTNFELQMAQQKRTNLRSAMLFDWAATNQADFVLLDYLNDSANYYPQLGTPQIGLYHLLFSDKQFAIYIQK
jgi:hypothetical protein